MLIERSEKVTELQSFFIQSPFSYCKPTCIRGNFISQFTSGINCFATTNACSRPSLIQTYNIHTITTGPQREIFPTTRPTRTSREFLTREYKFFTVSFGHLNVNSSLHMGEFHPVAGISYMKSRAFFFLFLRFSADVQMVERELQ